MCATRGCVQDPQRIRLRQLALQAEGPVAFREPEVVEALALAPGQRERIRAIEDEALFGQIREMQSGRVPEGSGQPARPTTRAGTPATVTLFGTDLSRTEPAAMRAQCPTSMLPRILAPAPIITP